MRPSVLVSVALVVVGLGCGGATETGLFGSGSGTSDDAGQTTDGAQGDGTVSTTDGGLTRRDGGTKSDSGAGFDGGAHLDPGIPCGSVDCTVGTQYCCATNIGASGGPDYVCDPAGASACTGVRLPCNDTADCHGAVCCGTFDNNVGYTEIACRAACLASTPTTMSVRFCDPNAPIDECDASGMSCQPSQALPGFSICK